MLSQKTSSATQVLWAVPLQAAGPPALSTGRTALLLRQRGINIRHRVRNKLN